MTKEECLLILVEKQKEVDRFPQKNDFLPEEVAYIKSYFGPWSHALEAAGIKESKKEERLKKNKEKHIQAKINRRNAKINKSEVKK